MTDETSFYFDGPASANEIQTLEISHPSFSKVWRVQGKYRSGLWARDEANALQWFDYVPLALRPLEDRGNLDFGLTVTFGDLGEILPDEIERARAAGTMHIKPTVIYRAYRSDDLAGPMVGPITLEARKLNRQQDGAQFDATAPELNVSKTGELYTLDRFPGLRIALS
ncbi:DUF1833 family protein [Bordetella sp. 15P40C-2]|uniref:DUF1833 family protein n=1 Tax=Bordetella sp. 15P40C-2 TaxID=2572246 RepID=UPI0013273D88|nr:DUF1833 family protein [Bordetella sp. 15P40C-2]MVW72128.1 DUF1833 domain-containing protein [Bordetella sp. 15P40C-2]